MNEREAGEPKRPRSLKKGVEGLKGLPRWKKVLLGCAAVLLVVGLVGQAIAMASGPVEAPSGERKPSGERPPGVNTFMPSDGDRTGTEAEEPPPAKEDDSTLREWSPALVKLGFSFFVGLAIGYALRTFLKLTLIIVGINLLVIFGLEYIGFLSVNWGSMDQAWSNLVEGLKDEFSAFKAFIEGSLPSAAAFGTGVFTAFKKR